MLVFLALVVAGDLWTGVELSKTLAFIFVITGVLWIYISYSAEEKR